MVRGADSEREARGGTRMVLAHLSDTLYNAAQVLMIDTWMKIDGRFCHKILVIDLF
jgi:hypothetical protein